MDVNTYDRFQVAVSDCFPQKDRLKKMFKATWEKYHVNPDGKKGAWLVAMHRLTELIGAFPRARISSEVKAMASLAEVRSIENFLAMLNHFGVILIDDANRLHAWAPVDLTTRPPSQDDYVSLYKCGWKRGTFTLPTYTTHPLQAAVDDRSEAIRGYMASETRKRQETPQSATQTVDVVRAPSQTMSDVHWEGVRR